MSAPEINRAMTAEEVAAIAPALRAGQPASGWLVYPAGPGAKRAERWFAVAILPDGWKAITRHNSAAKAEAAAKAALAHGMRPLPDRAPDGDFGSFQTWVNKAASWIGGTNSLCADALGRKCRIGADFMRARDGGAFPVRYWHGEGGQTPVEQRSSRAATARVIGPAKLRMREMIHGY